MVGCEWRLRAGPPERALVLPPSLPPSPSLTLLAAALNSLISQFIPRSTRRLPQLCGSLRVEEQLQQAPGDHGVGRSSAPCPCPEEHAAATLTLLLLLILGHPADPDTFLMFSLDCWRFGKLPERATDSHQRLIKATGQVTEPRAQE